MVQIHSPRPFFIFCPLENQVEGLSVCWPETYAIGGTVQKHSFQQLASFCVISCNVQSMRLCASAKFSPQSRRAQTVQS